LDAEGLDAGALDAALDVDLDDSSLSFDLVCVVVSMYLQVLAHHFS
jgi:hypothetical protein